MTILTEAKAITPAFGKKVAEIAELTKYNDHSEAYIKSADLIKDK